MSLSFFASKPSVRAEGPFTPLHHRSLPGRIYAVSSATKESLKASIALLSPPATTWTTKPTTDNPHFYIKNNCVGARSAHVRNGNRASELFYIFGDKGKHVNQ